MKKLNHLFFMLLTLAFFACDDDTEDAIVDTEDPTISIQTPTGQEEIFADDAVGVKATVRDNLGLETVTISVTPPGKPAQVVHTEEVRDFLNDNKEADIEETISLGTGTPAAGDYIITVRAIDKRANEATQSVTISVIEADTEAPVLAAITSPTAGQEFARGQDITITSSAEDNKNLETVMVKIASGDNEWHSTTFDAEDFGDDFSTFDIMEVVKIPDTAPIGTHTITISAVDARGNEATNQTVDISVVQEAGQ